jgi:hypothetical protein
MSLPDLPKLTDGVIFLRPLDAEDAAEHFAGEDEEMARWVSGGRSTMADVEAFIRNNQKSWQTAGRAVPLAYSILRAIDWPVSLK